MARAEPSPPKRRFVSVGTKLAGAMISVLVVVTAVLEIAVSKGERENRIGAEEMAATMVARLFTAGVTAPLTFGDDKGAQEQASLLMADRDVVYGAVWSIDPENPSRVRDRVGEASRRADIGGAPVVGRESRTTLSRDWVLVESPVFDPSGKLVGVTQVALSLEDENAASAAAERRTVLASFAMAVGLAAVLLVVTRTLIVRRLGRLAAAAKRLEDGETGETAETVEIAEGARDEVGDLARAFSAMSHAIETREALISTRNRELRRVLDNVDEGFLTADLHGAMCAERSRIVDEWFGPGEPGESFFHFVERVAPPAAPWIHLGWESLREDVLPLELIVEQLPHGFDRGGRFFEVDYRPILEGGAVAQVLVVIRDVSQRIEKERAERAQREAIAIFRKMISDRPGFEEFLAEASELVAWIARDDVSDEADGSDEAHEAHEHARRMRAIHTLKGITALFGVESLSTLCHAIESRITDEGGAPTSAEKAQLRTAWSQVRSMCDELGGSSRERIEVGLGDYDAILASLERRTDHDVIAARVRAWRYERAAARVQRLADQVRLLARRLGRGEVIVRTEVSPRDLRLPPSLWASFWTVFAHVVRNTVDHGIETPEEREAAGKSGPALITIALRATSHEVHLDIADDGPGIAWDKIRDRAAEVGLPINDREALEEALYADAVSSRRDATEISGRGVGMGAVRDVVRSVGGGIAIDTVRGGGTTIRFRFPSSMLADATPRLLESHGEAA